MQLISILIAGLITLAATAPILIHNAGPPAHVPDIKHLNQRTPYTQEQYNKCVPYWQMKFYDYLNMMPENTDCPRPKYREKFDPSPEQIAKKAEEQAKKADEEAKKQLAKAEKAAKKAAKKAADKAAKEATKEKNDAKKVK